MKVKVVTASVSRSAGGIFDALLGSTQAIRRENIDVSVASLRDLHTDRDRAAWRDVDVSAFPVVGPSSIGYSPMLKRAVTHCDAELLHTHGIWMYPSACTANWARERRGRYIISPHGMLDPWILNRSRAKKWIARAIYENEHLRNAVCFHALNAEEVQAIRSAGLTQPIAVIPNGVELPSLSASGKRPTWWKPEYEGKRIILYLGRLHPKKGLTELLSAWRRRIEQRLDSMEAVLIVAGWGDEEYRRSLLQIVDGNLEKFNVAFVGSVYGEDKTATYRNASWLVLPSFSEGLPMVPLEAWAHGCAAALSRNCNLTDAFSLNAAVQITPDAAVLAEELSKLICLGEEDVASLAANGLAMVKDRYTWTNVGKQFAATYRWMMSQEQIPDFFVL